MHREIAQSPTEVKRLQRCINDLISVLALPAIWTGSEPSQVAGTLLEFLLGLLELDLVYVRLNGSSDEQPLEQLRVSRTLRPVPHLQEVASSINDHFQRDTQSSPCAVVATSRMSLVRLPLGLRGELGLVVAGSQRRDFPQQTERLVLNVAANQASIGLQEARLLIEQKRVTAELDARVAERSAELASINDTLRNEIVERRKMEDRLRESEAALIAAFHHIKNSEARLRRVIDTVPALAWCNLPDGPNEFLNRRWHEYTGLSPEESHGWGWQVAFHPVDLPALMQRWGELLVSGQPGEMEARLRRHDGIYRWFLIRVEPFRDESGKIIRWYGTSTDIEDRKRAEEQLRRSEAFLVEGQNLAKIGSFSWLVATDEIKWSEQLYRIFEFEIGSPISLERIGQRVHPEDVSQLQDMIAKARHAANDFEYAHRLLMTDGRIKHLHLIAHANRDSENRLEYIGAVQDVTQRKVSDEALGQARLELGRVSRVKSLAVLTASIAHELNQPLSGIITNASTCLRMLSADPANVEGARETARRTIRDGNRASDVITRLRALFARRHAPTELVDLNEATREVLALSSSEFQRDRVTVYTDLREDLPLVIGDRVQLQQVILNLLRNACDAMRSINERPRLLSIRTEVEGEGSVRVSVQDCGVGFDRDVAVKLFDPFYTTKEDGMGIGLSVSRSIIESHDGRLWATLNDGHGATFAFSLPYAQEARNKEVGAA